MGLFGIFIRDGLFPSLITKDNNLFYRIHFIVFIVWLLLFWFFFSFFFVTLCLTRNKTEMDVWLCQTNKPANTYNANEKLETSTVLSFLSPSLFISFVFLFYTN